MPRTTTTLTTVDRKLVKVLQRIYTVIRVSPQGPHQQPGRCGRDQTICAT